MSEAAYSQEMEELILSYLLRNKSARDASKGVLKTEHFSEEANKVFLLKMHGRPDITDRLFKEDVLRHVHLEKLPKDKAKHFLEQFDKVSKPLPEAEETYVAENLNKFIKSQNIKLAFMKAADLYKSEKWDEIETLITDAVNSGFETTDLGTDYLNDVEKRLEERRNQPVTYRIGTGLKDADSIMGGGIENGQVFLIVGGTGRGKSITLQHIGRTHLLYNQNVVYYSLELSEAAIAQRMDVAESRIPVVELVAQEDAITEAVNKLKSSTTGTLYIKHMIPKKTTVGHIQSHIKLLKSKGITPNSIMIDYLDLLGSSRKYDDPHHETENTIIELVAMAQEEGIKVFTASQLNRAGMVAEEPDESSIAGSVSKLYNVDVVVFLAQTKMMREARLLKWCFGKNRNGPAGVSVDVSTDFGFFTFYSRHVDCNPEEDYTDVEING